MGSDIGAEWARIQVFVDVLNRTLGAVGIVALLVLVIVLLVRRRRRARARIWRAIRRALGETGEAEFEAAEVEPVAGMRSAALLLLELAYADEALTRAERDEVVDTLRSRWGLGPVAHTGVVPETHPERTRWAAYRAQAVERFAHERRLALVERLWQVAFASGTGLEARDRLARRAGELLGFTPEEMEEAARRAREASP